MPIIIPLLFIIYFKKSPLYYFLSIIFLFFFAPLVLSLGRLKIIKKYNKKTEINQRLFSSFVGFLFKTLIK